MRSLGSCQWQLSMKPNQNSPVPQGNYLPAVRHGNLIYTSGMTPRQNGMLKYKGKILTGDSVQQHAPAVMLAIQNALTAAKNLIADHEKIICILQLSVYLNTDSTFKDHSKFADIASNFIAEKLGPQAIGTRAAIGVNSLPSNASIEISLVASVE